MVRSAQYFLSSPYMIQQMDAAMVERTPFLMRKHKQHLTRLRRGDASCTHLVDDQDRVVLAPALPLPASKTHRTVPDPCESGDEEKDVQVDNSADRDVASTVTTNSNAVPVKASASLPSQRTATAGGSRSGFRWPERPLLLFWLDGAQRYLPFNLALNAIASRPPSHSQSPLALVSGGSLGLQSRVLDHKTSMHALLSSHHRTYIPATRPFSVADPAWADGVRQWLSDGAPSDFAILKPSEGLKQKGLLVIERDPARLAEVVAHVDEWGRRYSEWVLQTLVTEPFCVSGLDLGLVKGSPVPSALYPGEEQMQVDAPTKAPEEDAAMRKQRRMDGHASRRRTLSPLRAKKFTFPTPDTAASSSPSRPTKATAALPSPLTAEDMAASSDSSSSLSSSPAPSPSPSPTSHAVDSPPSSPSSYPRARVGQLPSDSGRPVDCLGLYKVHFRIYAVLRHDSVTGEYVLFLCDLFKLYHAPEPSATITPGREREPLSAKLLTAMANDTATLAPLSSLTPASPLTSLSQPGLPGQSISNSLAKRLGNDVLSPALIAHVMPSFTAIVSDVVSLALPQLLPWPGVASTAFQVYGFDLLWDVGRDAAVLLEVNENVGQGIHKRELMCGQGMEGREYDAMRRYWKAYRTRFSEGLINVTVDEAIGRGRDDGNVWKEIKRFRDGRTYRELPPAAQPKRSSSKPQASAIKPKSVKRDSRPSPTPEAAADPALSGAGLVPPTTQNRRASHRRLTAALEHARRAVTSTVTGSRPFLTGQPQPSVASGDDAPQRVSRAELHDRYAVRARRRSMGAVGKAASKPTATANALRSSAPSDARAAPVVDDHEQTAASSTDAEESGSSRTPPSPASPSDDESDARASPTAAVETSAQAKAESTEPLYHSQRDVCAMRSGTRFARSDE